jgi:hypothetical protein
MLDLRFSIRLFWFPRGFQSFGGSLGGAVGLYALVMADMVAVSQTMTTRCRSVPDRRDPPGTQSLQGSAGGAIGAADSGRVQVGLEPQKATYR